MVLYGVVRGTDEFGNYKVIPDNGGKIVILSNSAGSEFYIGQRVTYDVIEEGYKVDFAKRYKPADLEGRIATNAQSIVDALSHIDVSGISTLIIFDPVQEGSYYHFILISKTAEMAMKAIDTMHHIGFEGDGSEPTSLYQSSNDLIGIRHYVINDFREQAANEPRINGMLFIPLEGLVYKHRFVTMITNDVFKSCVESARLG